MSGTDQPDGRAERLLGALLARRGWVLAAWALVAAAALPGLPRLETDNSPAVYFVQGSPSLAAYGELVDAFGATEQVRLLVSGRALWTADGLERLGELERRTAERVPHAVEVLGLAGHRRALGEPWPPEDPAGLRERAAADPLDRQLGLVGKAGTVASVLVLIAPPDNRAEERTVAALRELAREASAGTGGGAPALDVRVAGLPVVDLALDASSREIGRVYFPLLIGLAVLLLAAALRTVRGVLLPLLFVAAPELVLLGTLGYLGVTLNLVLAVLPPLLFVISLATAVHLTVRFRDALEEGAATGADRTGRLDPGDPRGAAVLETYRDKGWAVFWTGVTTAIGFGSLTVSRVGPVPTLGIASAAGIGLMTLAAFTLYPALLASFGGTGGAAGAPRSRGFENRFRHLGRAWAERAVRRRGAVLTVTALVVAAALTGVPRLRVESNAVRFLPDEHPARQGIEALDRAGIGAAALEVLLTLPEGEQGRGFLRPERLAALGELAARLRELPEVHGAVGGGDVLAAARSRVPPGMTIGPGAFGSSLVLQGLLDDPRGRGILGTFVALGDGEEGSAEGRSARVIAFVAAAGYREITPTIEAAAAAARRALPGVGVDVTGQYPLVLETHRRLLATLGLSLTLTTLAVGLLFRWLLPSTRLALLALAPNLWPVVVTVGFMGWAGIPLDTATVMVASVVLGLAVDDTIHTLGHFRELAPRSGRREAVAGTLERTAPAYVLTGVILAAGFGVCALSDFAPTARFGGLSALAIVLAVTGDLVLLPALLGSTPRSVVRRMRSRSARRGG